MQLDVFLFFVAFLLIFFLLTLKVVERKRGRTILFPRTRKWADRVVVRSRRVIVDTTRYLLYRAQRKMSHSFRRSSRGVRIRLIRWLGGRE